MTLSHVVIKPTFKLMTLRRLILLGLMLCACSVGFANQAPVSEANPYYVWACGDETTEAENANPDGKSYLRSTYSWENATNVNDFTELWAYALCPDTDATSDTTGIAASVKTFNLCDFNTGYRPSDCFQSWANGSAYSKWTFQAPPGTTITSSQLRLGVRSRIPTGTYKMSGLNYFQWVPSITNQNGARANIPSVDSSGASNSMLVAPYTYKHSTGTSSQYSKENCSFNRAVSSPSTSGDFNCIWQIRTLLNFNMTQLFSDASATPVTQLNVNLECNPYHSVSNYTNYCPETDFEPYTGSGESYFYAGRINLRAARISVDDAQNPAITAMGSIAGSLGDAATTYYRGTVSSAQVSASDNVSPYKTQLSLTNDAGGTAWSSALQENAMCKYYKVISSSSTQNNIYPNTWTKQQPCGTTLTEYSNRYGSVNTASLSDGSYSFKATVWDISGRTGTASRSVVIDNNQSTTCSSAPNQVTAPTGVGSSNQWIGGTATVTARVCDPISGVQSADLQAQVNGGSWTTVCTNTTGASGNNAYSFSCPYNTSGPAEGSPVSWRVVVTDKAGNVSSPSSQSDTRYIDNEAPQASVISFDADGTYPWTSKSSPADWTNAQNITAKWSQTSAGNGSPINWVKAAYRASPGSSCPWATTLLSASATSITFEGQPSSCTELSAQGTHSVYVWAADLVGNQPADPTTNTVSGKVASASFKWDSIAPAITSLTVNPGGWTRINAFSASFTAPTVAAATQSPLKQTEYQVGDGVITSLSSCTEGLLSARTGQLCTIGSTTPSSGAITAPGGGGQFQLKAWVRDEAGNADKQNGASDTMKFDDTVCIR
jgi:hypothetical protein